MEWRYLSTVQTGQVLGADSFMNPLVDRNNYLYGVATAKTYLFKQKTWEGHNIGTPGWGWTGVTTYRSEHTQFHFSAGVRLENSGSSTQGVTVSLQIWAKTPGTENYGWQTLDSWTFSVAAGTTDNAFFNNTQWNTYDISSYEMQDESFRARFYVTGIDDPNTETYRIWVFYAALSGGEQSLDTNPTFDDGIIPTATDFNTILSNQEKLKYRADKPFDSAYLQKLEHHQADGYLGMYHGVFRYLGMGELTVEGLVEGITATTSTDASINIQITSFDQDNTTTFSGGGDFNYTLRTIDSSITNGLTPYPYSETFDLTTIGMTPGNLYKVYIGIKNDAETDNNPKISLTDLSIQLRSSGDGRTSPMPRFSYLDQPTAAQLNLICDDIDNLNNGDYILYSWHPLTTWMFSEADYAGGITRDHGGTIGGAYVIETTLNRYKILHRHRWLRWIGQGRIESVTRADGTTDLVDENGVWKDPLFSYDLGDSKIEYDSSGNTISALQTLDLDSISWLAYGMEYFVTGAYVAFEDYALTETECG